MLVAATWAGFLLRHTGVASFLPEADERVYTTQMDLLRTHEPHPERTHNFSFYPLTIARLALLTETSAVAPPTTVDEHVATASADLRHARTLVALLAALAIPATYFLARSFLTSGWALFAALLFAASPLAIVYGQQARPHAALVAPAVCAMLACLLVQKRPVMTSYLLAGLGIGASLSILHSGAAVIPALFAAHWLRDRSRERHAWLGLFAAIGLAGLIAYLAYPSGATGFETHSNGTELFDLSGHAVVLDRFRGGGFVNFARATWDFEPWLALLAGAGCVLFVMQRRRAQPAGAPNAREKLIVLAAWCVPYFVVCGLYDFSYERFLVQLLPCAALAAAYACTRLSRAAWPAHSTISAALIGVLALAPQAFFAVRLARAWGEPDTLTRCARWLREEVPPGSARLAVFHTIDLPLLRYAGSLHENWRQRFDAARPWIVYQDRLAPDALLGERYDLVTVPFGGARGLERFDLDPAASIASWNADYVIVETGRAERMHSSEALLEQLRSTAVRVARFSPYSDPKETAPFDFQQVASTQGWWTERLCKAVGSGPVVEVYRLH